VNVLVSRHTGRVVKQAMAGFLLRRFSLILTEMGILGQFKR
jgi:hypothetical protein